MAIEIRNISKSFGPVRALSDVSLTLEEGHIYGLLGDNGAGKSTLLGIVTNRLYPDAGEVLVDGVPAAGNDAALGKLFLVEEQNLFPEELRVKKAFRLLSWFYPAFDAARALELSARFGLNVKSKIKALSTGYASIFRNVLALSVNAPYLLLDEPVLGLDARHRDLFYRLLLEHYAATGCTVILSTHLIAEAANLIERAVILREGRVLEDAPAEDLLAAAYTVSGPAAAVDAYTADKAVLSQGALGGLKTACVRGPRPETAPAGLELGRVNLQDYFIRLMDEEEERA